MTNRIAVSLAFFVAALFVLDRFAYEGAAAFFVVQKFVDLVEYVAFWR